MEAKGDDERRVREMSDKIKIGTRVNTTDGVTGVVVKHGYDGAGIYTMIETFEHERIKYHRSQLKRLTEEK